MRKASIEFEKKESVKQAIAKFNDTKLKEHEIKVDEFVLKEKAPREPRKPRAKTAEPKKFEAKPKVVAEADKSDRKEKRPPAKRAASAAPKEEKKIAVKA